MKGKKVLAIISALCLLLMLFTACGGNNQAEAPAEEPPAAEAPAPAPEPEPADEPAVDDEVYTIRMIASWNPGTTNWPRMEILKTYFEEKSGGRLIIDLVGGTDVFPADETAEAVSQGVVDGCYTAGSQMSTYVPEADVLSVSDMTNQEMIDSGGWDFLNEILAQHDLYMVSCNQDFDVAPFCFTMCEEITTLDDFKGKKVRTSAGFWNEIADQLGATAVPLPLGETFTALEQGLVEGYTAPTFMGGNEGFFEYAKYTVRPGFLRPAGCMLVNTNFLATLPADLQELLTTAGVELAMAWRDECDSQLTGPNVDKLIEAGGKVCELSAEDGQKLQEIAQTAYWGAIEDKAPANTPKLKELFMK